MAGSFRFKQFEVRNESSALKVGTDAVLLGAAMTILPEDRRALDIGTGTGVIALMAAQRSSGCRITGIDIDAASAGEAAFNFASSPWSDRLTALHSSLSLYTPEGDFDLIFSNPPFYDNSLKNPDRRESIARHTETLSYREILAFAQDFLAQEGRLSIILPFDRAAEVVRCAASFGLFPFRKVEVRTVASKPPKRSILEFSRKRVSPAEETLTLQEGGLRSEEYQNLTKNFYL